MWTAACIHVLYADEPFILEGLEFFVDLLLKRIEKSLVHPAAHEQGPSTPHKSLRWNQSAESGG